MTLPSTAKAGPSPPTPMAASRASAWNLQRCEQLRRPDQESRHRPSGYRARTLRCLRSGARLSRKTHGAAEPFDLEFPLTGAVGVEPRRGGGVNANNHQVVFKFAQPVTFSSASVTPQNGKTAFVESTSPPAVPSNEVVVNLSNVANAQTINVTLLGLSGTGLPTTISVPMGILLGDTNADRTANSGDAQQTRNRSGQLDDFENFRSDVNVDGTINSGDALSSGRVRDLHSLASSRI